MLYPQVIAGCDAGHAHSFCWTNITQPNVTAHKVAVYAFGANPDGQLGLGSSTNTTIPTRVGFFDGLALGPGPTEASPIV